MHFSRVCIVLALVCTYVAHCAPTGNNGQKKSVKSETDAMAFLSRFGYDPLEQDKSPGAAAAPAAITASGPSADSIRRFQHFMGLPLTGVLDERTMEEMNKPRCGRPDTAPTQRSRRFAIAANKWPKTSLSYIITRYTSDLSTSLVRHEIRRAFQVWEAVTPLRFTEVFSGDADIIILFAPGSHGDNEPFDGPSNVLAHAYFPTNGDAHFDDAETWTLNTNSGINLFQVAAHEFGHSLGLDHSDVQAALMYPSYNGYQPDFQLDQDDINGIQALYGSPETTSSTQAAPTTSSTQAPTTASTQAPTTSSTKAPTTSSTQAPTTTNTKAPTTTSTPRTSTTSTSTTTLGTSDGPSACDVSRFDAVTITADGSVYLFSGEYYYELDAADARTARRISEHWQHVSGPVDAAITLNGQTLLMQDNVFHLFENQERFDNYVRSTAYFFPGIASTDLSAAWIWQQQMFVSRGASYWRYNHGNTWLDAYYPRQLSAYWRGLPWTVDAAVNDGAGNIYFFKGSDYYVFNIAQDRVVQSRRSVADDIFGCSSSLHALTRSELLNNAGQARDLLHDVMPSQENQISREPEATPDLKMAVAEFATLIKESGDAGVVRSVNDITSGANSVTSVSAFVTSLMFVLVVML